MIRLRPIPLLPTWIYSCRLVGMVSCALPVTTSVTNGTSISRTFRFGVAIFHLRWSMASLSHSSYSIPGLAHLLRAAQLLCQLRGQGYVREHVKSFFRKFYGRFYQTLWSLPLSNVTLHSGTWPYTVTPSTTKERALMMLYNLCPIPFLWIWNMFKLKPQLIRNFTKSWPCCQTGPYYRLWRHFQIPEGFYRTFATGAASQQRTLSPDTWSCPVLICAVFKIMVASRRVLLSNNGKEVGLSYLTWVFHENRPSKIFPTTFTLTIHLHFKTLFSEKINMIAIQRGILNEKLKFCLFVFFFF